MKGRARKRELTTCTACKQEKILCTASKLHVLKRVKEGVQVREIIKERGRASK